MLSCSRSCLQSLTETDVLRRWFPVVVFATCLLPAQEADPKRQSTPLTLQEVVKLTKSELSEELIVARIKRNNRPFDLNGDEILELRKSGVSETVIKYLLDPGLPYTPPPPPRPPEPLPPKPAAPAKPLDPVSAKVPEESGLYWLSGNEKFVRLELRTIIPSGRSGKVTSVLTGGLKKGSIVGSATGSSAKIRIPHSASIFFFRVPEKVSVDDLVLLKLEKEKERRDLSFGARSEKPVFPAKSVVLFESKQVAPGLVRVSVGALPAGEYLFFILGSGDERKSVFGKGYEFGVGS
jgi:hypothetical protein